MAKKVLETAEKLGNTLKDHQTAVDAAKEKGTGDLDKLKTVVEAIKNDLLEAKKVTVRINKDLEELQEEEETDA